MARSADRARPHDKATIQASKQANDERLAKQAAETTERRAQEKGFGWPISKASRKQQHARWEHDAKQSAARAAVATSASRRANEEYVCQQRARTEAQKLATERSRVLAIRQADITRQKEVSVFVNAILAWRYRPDFGDKFKSTKKSFEEIARTQVSTEVPCVS